MIEITAIAAATNGLNAAINILKGALSLRDEAKLLAAISDANREILSAQTSALAAQSTQFTLLEQISALKAEIAQFEKWETEKDKYEMKAVKEGAFAYARKPDAEPREPDHWLCQYCYEQRVKSIYQAETRQPGLCRVLACHRCGSAIYLTGFWVAAHGSPKTAPSHR